MPIDYRIHQGLQGARPLSDMYAGQATLLEARQKRDALRQQSIDQAAIRRVLQESGGDPEKAIPLLMQHGLVGPASALQKQVDESRKAHAEAQLKKLDIDDKQWTQLTRSASMVTPENYGPWRQMVNETDPRLGQMLQPEYSPDGVARFGQMMIDAKEKMVDDRARWSALLSADTTRRGQDMSAETAAAGQGVAMRGQDMTAATAQAGQGVTMRGQDMTAGTARRGQDIGAATARAGQSVTMRGQDMTAAAAKAGAPGAKAGPNVANIMAEIGTLSTKINTEPGGPGSVIGGYARKLAASGGMDNNVAEYEALVNGMIPMVARANGHTGVLTQQDVDSTRELFPQVTDNATLAKNKLARVNRLIQGAGGAAPDAVVPETVASALKSVGDGRHTLSDGSVWEKRGTAITPVK